MSVELLPNLSVSRETFDTLKSLETLLSKWNPAINLVARSTIPSAWTRHIIDSAQIFPTMAFDTWVDLGSGGGFPGLVIAALSREFYPSAKITLVEIDQRKATFLREAARSLGLTADVLCERIEGLAPLSADVLSARALAPLDVLCGYADRHLNTRGVALFPKGAGWRAEVDFARRNWMFELEAISSKTDSEAVILQLKGIRHV